MSIRLDGLPKDCIITTNSQGRVFAYKKFEDGSTRIIRWGTTEEEDERGVKPPSDDVKWEEI